MQHRPLVILTDCYDIAASEIKGQFCNLLKDDICNLFIDVVPIKPFSVIHGQFSLRLLADSYPENTCFYVVLNPLKIQPLRVFGRTDKKNFLFCGRNTGVFDWLVQDFGCRNLFEVSSEPYSAFGGKNIYPKVLSKILRGTEPSSFLRLIEPNAIKKSSPKNGTVVHIDNFGIIKIKDSTALFTDMGLVENDRVSIRISDTSGCKTNLSAIYTQRVMSQESNTLIVCHGSSLGGLPEIACVRNAEWLNKHKIHIGDHISFQRG